MDWLDRLMNRGPGPQSSSFAPEPYRLQAWNSTRSEPGDPLWPSGLTSAEIFARADAGLSDVSLGTPFAGTAALSWHRLLEQERMAAEMASIETFEPTVTLKSWGEEILIAHVPGKYAGKLLKRYVTGTRAGLVFHESRDETFHLVSGEVIVYWVDADGVLRKRAMHPGQSFHVPPGAVHSVQTLTDSLVFEASSGAYPDSVNVEADWDISKAVES